MRDFVQSVLDNKEHPHQIVIQVATAEKRSKVLKETGVDIGSAKEILIDERVVHAQKDHPSLTLDDWAILPEIAETFNEAYEGREEGDPKTVKLIFVKRGEPKDYAYIAEFANGKSRGERLRLITFFKDTRQRVDGFLENNRKRKDKEQAGAGLSPSIVSKTPSPSTSSKTTVEQAPDQVKPKTCPMGYESERGV
ncbi:hypothetical protein AGMMS50256_38610 [Betaproteobacteria bacterium]|nr:hypothetical protein AGMMS50256_38610 [Betaproteobacteria bacterium]